MYEPFLGIPAVGEMPLYLGPLLLWASGCGAYLAIFLSSAEDGQRPLRSRATLGWLAAISVIALVSHTAFRIIPARYAVFGFMYIIPGSLLAAYVGVRVSGNWTRGRLHGASAIILAELLIVYGTGIWAVWKNDESHVTRCKNSLKMIHSAIDEYRADHSSSYPPEKGWSDSILPYLSGQRHYGGHGFLVCGYSRLAEVKWNTRRETPDVTYSYHKPPAHCPSDFAMVTCDHVPGKALPAQRIVLQVNGKTRRDEIRNSGP